MHSFVPVAVAALAPFAAASAVLPEFVDFSVLIARQEPGTPAYQCHYDCGNVIVGGRTEGYCDDSTWQDEFQGCMECALTYDIWQYYGNSVTSAAEACGLAVNPSPSGSVASSTAGGAATTTTAAAVTTTPAEEPTSTTAQASSAAETSSPAETSAPVSTGAASQSAAVSTSHAGAPSTTAGSVGTTSGVTSASPTSSLVTVSGASKGQTMALVFGTLASAITAALLM